MIEAELQFDIDKVRVVFPNIDNNIRLLEKSQDHIYRNKSLAAQALFHSSAIVHWPKDKTGITSNERLEFLGDSFLNFVVSRELVIRFPKANEGELSKLRAAIVGTNNLVRAAGVLNLKDCVVLGRGELTDLRNENHGFLADTFEAVLAALMLDSNEDIARRWVIACLGNEIATGTALLNNVDAKSRFQEWLQAFVNITPRYELVETEDSSDGPQFVMSGTICDVEFARAKAKNKREASRLVAEALLTAVTEGRLTKAKVMEVFKASEK